MRCKNTVWRTISIRFSGLITGAGIRVAGVHHQCEDALASRAHAVQMLAAKRHGGSTEAVLGEHTRHRRAFVDGNDEHVLAVRLADVRLPKLMLKG